MSSGSKGGRSSKGSKGGINKNAGGGSIHNEHSKADHNHNDKDNIPHKIAPTAEQLRIAQMIDNTHSEPEKVLHEKMNQIMQVTGLSSDDAMVALHDCNNDVNAAIDALLEGDDQGEWRETTTKKKKKSPATKVPSSKEDPESNKENRHVDNRERSNSRRGSGAPRFRGRGGGRKVEESSDGGVGRGSNSRRRGMANGTTPVSRGRGARGRGSSAMNSRTFQKRQPPGFTETIDTWGAPSPEKVDTSNSLQIDNWDEDRSGTTEDWDGEWTGSLEKTTVFGASSTSEPIVNNHPANNMILTEPKVVPPPTMIAESVTNVLSLGHPQSLNQSIDLAALLQKAAPHSTLGRLPPSPIVDGSSSLTSVSLGNEAKANLLSGIQATSPDGNNVNVPVSLPGSQSYSSSSAAISNSIFSNSMSNLGSLSSGGGVSKVLGLSSQSSSLASRSKPQNRRLPPNSSKIPSSAVEMPEIAMAALDMQFTGLEFGTETFDFTSDVKPVMVNSMVPGSNSSSVSKDLSSLNASLAQPQNSYNSNPPTGVSGSSYVGGGSVNSTSNNNNAAGGNASTQSSGGYGSNFSTPAASGQYQNNYVNASSHSLTSISVPKSLSGLKETTQSYNDSVAVTGNLNASLATSASTGSSNSGTGNLQSSHNSAASSSVQPAKSSVPGKSVNSLGNSVPPGAQQHSGSQSQQQQHQVTPQQQQQQPMNQQHQHHLQQVAQTQQTQLMAGPSQYVSPQAAIPGTMPPFYNVQQPAMYSFEDLQMFQQRIPHMTAPTTMTGGRDGSINTPASYSVADAAKFRTDQNSSPVPSTINQQGAAAAGTYITATQNAAIPPPFYMYQTMPPVPNNFTQYGAPAIIQIPPNTHTGSSNTQFPGPPKLPYGTSSTYYDGISQSQDYKAGYGSGSQGQTKTVQNSTGSASNQANDLSSYKNHLAKVTRNYEKPGFHAGNPQTFNLAAGSGTNYAPMFIPAQHHSQLLHQLHQDGSSTGGQRSGTGGAQNKGGSKGSYSGSYWGN